MGKVLGKKFFERNAVEVAEDLIGKEIVRRKDGKKQRFIITETEAYEGTEDLASHASKGRTKRNEAMFGEAGNFYVYLVYGMYYMLNIVCGKKDHPAAVLIRGIKKEKWKEEKKERLMLNGPGKVTKFLSIDKSFNGKTASPKVGLWVEDLDNSNKIKVKKTPRIGVTYAGPVWSNKLWRFVYRV